MPILYWTHNQEGKPVARWQNETGRPPAPPAIATPPPPDQRSGTRWMAPALLALTSLFTSARI